MEIKDLLESEDGKAALTKAVEEETLGLKAKRDELLEANRKLRNELAARPGAMSKAAAKLSLAETTVQKLLVDNGLTEALTQAKVAPEFLEAARALIKSREEIGIGESEGKPVALIGEQALAGFVEDWARSEFYLDNPGALDILARAIDLHRVGDHDRVLGRALTFATRIYEVNGRPR